MSEPRQLAVVRSYDELLAALRARCAELDVSRETLDAITGLQTGYSGKLLASVPVKSLGRMSLGPMLTAMGLALVVVEDVETMRRMAKRHTKRHCAVPRDYADGSMPTKQRRKKPGFRGSEAGKLLRARGVLLIPRSERRRIAKLAAQTRWKREKSRKNHGF